MPKKTMLTEAEWKIMLVLWEHSPRTMMEVTRALEEETGWSKHTVATMLKRMIVKGTVRADQSGSVRTYVPAADKQQVAREQTQTLLRRLFDGKTSLMVSNMVEQGEIDDDEMREIIGILQEASGKRKEP